jgi:uncharacterized protein (DUF1778 family)
MSQNDPRSKETKPPVSKAHAKQERAALILSPRETQAFVDAILRPAEPGPMLRNAARNYKDSTGR